MLVVPHLLASSAFLLLLAPTIARAQDLADADYFGLFEITQHDVQGHLYGLNSRTLFIHRFYYDGKGPKGGLVQFMAVPIGEKDYAKGRPLSAKELRGRAIPEVLNQNLTLPLPRGLTVDDIERLVVWCEEYGVSFGRVDLTEARQVGRRRLRRPTTNPEEVGQFIRTEHDVSGKVLIQDEQTLLVRDFNYDGQGPSVVFFAGEEDSLSSGQVIQYPYKENVGILGPEKLKRIKKRDLVLRLPRTLSASRLRWLSVWCDTFEVSFGHVQFPKKK